ncbi:MAG: hypothetical protein AAF433_09815 [Bacteroidota bacterium]
MRLFFALIASLLFVLPTLSAQFQEFTYGGPEDEFSQDMIRDVDGNYLLAGATRSFSGEDIRAYLVKTDANGGTIWEQTYSGYRTLDAIFERSEGGYLAFVQRSSGSIGSGDDNVFLLELDEAGEELSSTYVANSDLRKVLATDDGHFLLLGQTSFNTDGCAHVLKVDRQANVLWSDCFGRAENDYAWTGLVDSDGNYLVGGISYRPGPPTGSESMLIKLSPDGSVLWEQYLGPNPDYGYYVSGIAEMPTGNYVLTELEQESQEEMDVQLHQVNRFTGASVNYYSFERPGREAPFILVPHPAGGYLSLGYTEMETAFDFDISLRRISPVLQPVWERTYGGPLGEFPYGVEILPDENLAIMGNTLSFGQGARDLYFLLANAEGEVNNRYLSGSVAYDTNLTCLIDTEEQLLSEWLIEVSGSNGATYALTDENGYYELPLANGDYTVSVLPPSNYWGACIENTPITVDGSANQSVDFAVQSVTDCPALESSVSSYFLQACQTGFLWVNYCNRGPATVGAADLYLTIDPLINIDSSEIDWISVDEQTYRFPIDTLGVNECRRFRVSLTLDCEVDDIQALLIESEIVPEESCPDGDDGFTGAFLEVDARCTGNQVVMDITNVGMEDMAGPLEYVVIEDAVLREAMPVDLAPQASFAVELPANGATYYLSIPQEPGAPGGGLVSAVIEGCGTNAQGDYSRGFTNQFLLTEGRSTTDLFYYPATLPSALLNGIAFPGGYTTDRLIAPNTPITYSVPFNFLAADTLSSFLLLVQPSSFLDVASLRVTGASHPYQMRMGPNNQIEFYFTDLVVHPNTTSEPGFVEFELAQLPDLSSGTIIENAYRLQTDFGQFRELVGSFHTVGENFIISNVDPDPTNPLRAIKTYPNPFVETVFFELSGLPQVQTANSATLVLEIFDYQGRMVGSEKYPIAPQISWDRGQLPGGTYAYRLNLGAQTLASGRIIMQ